VNKFSLNNLGNLELELERILLEKSDVQEILIKMEAMCSNYEQDKQRLQEELKKVGVKMSLLSAINLYLILSTIFVVR